MLALVRHAVAQSYPNTINSLLIGSRLVFIFDLERRNHTRYYN